MRLEMLINKRILLFSGVSNAPMERSDAKPISIEEISSISQIALRARKNVIKMQLYDQSIHAGSALSSIEVLATLLFRYRNDCNELVNRNWIILSKGHAAPALYAILAELAYFSEEELWKIGSVNAILQGHPETFIPGVDMSTGSLGQGLSFGAGIAASIKMMNGMGRVFVVMGDGETDEGQVWEAATHVVTRNLNNLTVIIEVNGIQLDGRTDEIKPKTRLGKVWEAIGWNVIECDGHDVAQISKAIDRALDSQNPTVILARTVRGKGFEPIENTKKQRVSPDIARKFIDA
ncbi:transketolase [Sulfolobales archaeon HS-7]|nr:transketolase [Sulfolobales archaeon HS-7]